METLLSEIEQTLSTAPESDIDRVEQRRGESPLAKTGVTLVTLDAGLDGMTVGDFDAEMERGDLSTRVCGLIEFWPDNPDAPGQTPADGGDGSGVLRVSGTDVPHGPQYFRAELSYGVFLGGRTAYDGWGVAHYDTEAIQDGSQRYLHKQRLFTTEGDSRLDELRDDLSLREYLNSEEFQRVLDHLDTLDSDAEREDFLDEYFGYNQNE